VGDRVRVVGEDNLQGQISGPPQSYGSTYFYDVQIGEEDDPALYPEEDLELVKSAGASPARWLLDQPLSPADEFGEFFTLTKLSTRLSDILYSYLSSRTVFRVYQFKPVLKFLNSPFGRLLIADEVGLGKTIEAGLIWGELDARMNLDRVLVVCPSALRRKWQLEMERRFDRDVPIILASAQLDELLERYVRQTTSSRFMAIAGLEMLRQDRNLVRLREIAPTFDLVIVDEAHHMRNTGTYSHQLGEFLSEAADHLLFLTATPINLGQPDLFNLMHLLLPEEFDNFEVFRSLLEPNRWVTASLKKLTDSFPPDPTIILRTLQKVEATRQARRYTLNPYYQEAVAQLQEGDVTSRRQVIDLQRKLTELNTLAHVYNRTRKRDLAERLARRQAVMLSVEWDEGEWRLYRAVREYVKARFRRLSQPGAALGFTTIMPERQAASCLPASRDYFLEMLHTRKIFVDLSEGEEELEGQGSESRLESRVPDPEVPAIRELVAAAERMGGRDSKYERLAGYLRELFEENPSAQVLIFSFFRRTLSYLQKRLDQEGFGVRRMDGSTPKPEREQIMEDFRERSFQILLSSEVGAEGLDFEFCQYLFNYDLPWNPMRLEQRIGRLDRFGQQHEKIFIVNFQIPGTVETDIFERLYDRIGIFEESIGELEPILGEEMRDLQRMLLDVELSDEQKVREADRIAHALEGKRVELEEFEQDRQRLIGQDDYIVEQIEDAQRQRKYITGEELLRLFSGFLKRVVGRPYQLKADPRDRDLYYFTANPRFGSLMRKHIRDPSPATFGLLAQLEAGTGLTLTFEADAAYRRRAEYLTFRHPFISAIIDYYRSEERLNRGGQIEIEGPRSGDFIFFIFLLEATGLVPRHTLLPVAVDMKSVMVDEDVSELILPGLSEDAVRTPEDRPSLLPEVVNDCHKSATAWAIKRRQELHQELLRTNEAIAVARQESLRQSLEVRTTRISQMARSATDERIRRMRSAQLRNLEQRIQAKLEQLERQKAVSVSIRALAGGYARSVQSSQ